MAYKKGNHCNNNCTHFFGEDVTIYNPHHGGNPGSTDYEQYQMYCCAKVADGERIYKVRYACPIYQAANTACTRQGGGVAFSSIDLGVTPRQ